MKKKVLLYFLLAVLSLPAAWAGAFDPTSFRIAVHRMLPQQYSPRELSYGYELAVRNDTVFCYLPYVGRIYQPVFDNDGLMFKAPLRDFKQTELKRKAVRVDFTTSRLNVIYRFRVTVEPDGRCWVRLTPSNGQSVSYEGELSEDTP